MSYNKLQDVTDYLIKLDQINEGDLTNLKLQKLAYYCQGFHLAKYDRPLFDQDIIAWDHGPVIRELYDKFKVAGRRVISADYETDSSLENRIENKSKEIIKDVFTVYGQFSAWMLRDLTHEEGTPWHKTKKNSVISHALMKEFFKNELKED